MRQYGKPAFGGIRSVEEARSQRPGIRFLQRDEVEIRKDAGEPIEVRALAGRQYVFPAMRHVLAIALDAAARKDVAAQYIQMGRRCAVGMRLGHRQRDRVRLSGSGCHTSCRNAKAACRRLRRAAGCSRCSGFLGVGLLDQQVDRKPVADRRPTRRCRYTSYQGRCAIHAVLRYPRSRVGVRTCFRPRTGRGLLELRDILPLAVVRR
jgi:hypothetical protein